MNSTMIICFKKALKKIGDLSILYVLISYEVYTTTHWVMLGFPISKKKVDAQYTYASQDWSWSFWLIGFLKV